MIDIIFKCKENFVILYTESSSKINTSFSGQRRFCFFPIIGQNQVNNW